MKMLAIAENAARAANRILRVLTFRFDESQLFDAK
jgi:hypothetical protein